LNFGQFHNTPGIRERDKRRIFTTEYAQKKEVDEPQRSQSTRRRNTFEEESSAAPTNAFLRELGVLCG
jgi:hypothetical protein